MSSGGEQDQGLQVVPLWAISAIGFYIVIIRYGVEEADIIPDTDPRF